MSRAHKIANLIGVPLPLIGLLLMRPSELYEVERTPRGKGQLREGLRYVAGRPDLIWPIVLVGFIGTFGFNFPIWLSAFAHSVYHAGASTYGMFNTAMAAGSLVGALLAARRATTRMRLLLGAALIFSGQPRVGIAAIQTAIKLDPHDPMLPSRLNHVTAGFYFCREYQTAVEMAKQAIRSNPDYPLTYRWLAAALGQIGENVRRVSQDVIRNRARD